MDKDVQNKLNMGFTNLIAAGVVTTFVLCDGQMWVAIGFLAGMGIYDLALGLLTARRISG